MRSIDFFRVQKRIGICSLALVSMICLPSIVSGGTRPESVRIDPAVPEPVNEALRHMVLTIRMDPIRVEMSAYSGFHIAEEAYQRQPGEVRFTPTCLWRVTGEVACATPLPAEHMAFRMADAQNVAQGAPRLFAPDLKQPSAWEDLPNLQTERLKSNTFLLPVARVRDSTLELSTVRCTYFLGIGRRRAGGAAMVGTYAACDTPEQPYDVVASFGLSMEGKMVTYLHSALWESDDELDELFSSPVPFYEALRFVDGEQFPGAAIFGASTWSEELVEGSGKMRPESDEIGNLRCGPELQFKVQNTEVRARSDRNCYLARLDLAFQDGQHLRLYDQRDSEDAYLFDEEDAASEDLIDYTAFFVKHDRPWPGLKPRSQALISAWMRALFPRRDGDSCGMYYPISFEKYTWNRTWKVLPGMRGKVGYAFGCVDPSPALGQVGYDSGTGSASLVDLAGHEMIVGIAHIEAAGFTEGIHSFFPGMPKSSQRLTIGGIAYVPADPEPFWISDYAGKTPVLQIRESLPTPGERMNLFGYPGGIGPVHSRCLFVGRLPMAGTQHWALCHLATVRTGEMLTWLSEYPEGETATQLSEMYKGNSGGPFVDQRGAFVGSLSNGIILMITRPESPVADLIGLVGFSPAHELRKNPPQQLGETASRSKRQSESEPVRLDWLAVNNDGLEVACSVLLQGLEQVAEKSPPEAFSPEAYAWLVREGQACIEH